MKKIVALALCLIMALSLATTAFAYSDDTFDVYKADSAHMSGGAVKANVGKAGAAVTITPHGASSASTGIGSIEYMTFDAALVDADRTGAAAPAITDKYVKTTTPTVADYAVTEAGKTAVLYYVTVVTDTDYTLTVKDFTNFGTSCGQLYKTVATDEYVEVTKGTGEGDVYKVDSTNGTVIALNGNKIVKLAAPAVTDSTTLTPGQILKHNWVVTSTKMDGATPVPTVVECAVCHAKSTAIYKTNHSPAGSKVVALTGLYAGYEFVVPGGAAGTTTAAGVTSAKTFDAGVALYAGMALMSVAGSAVVIGKKKEF